MPKKIIAVLLILLLSGCVYHETEPELPAEDGFSGYNSANRQGCGIWISWLDFIDIYSADEEQFIKNLDAVFTNLRVINADTVFLQVRAFGDAIYESGYFPFAAYLPERGAFDPLEVFIERAKSHGVQVHAWVNLFRLCQSDTETSDIFLSFVPSQTPANILLYNGRYYFDPSDDAAREYILLGIGEIIENYEVAGIHADDYFYPYIDDNSDKEHITQLVKDIYTLCHTRGKVFGISPDASLERNQMVHLADVELWGAQAGYVDYLCPQIYFGYDNDSLPFYETLRLWNEIVTCKDVKLYIGVAAYKIGKFDRYAGSGSEEWRQERGLLFRQSRDALIFADKVVYFRYGSLFMPEDDVSQAVSAELELIK